MLSGQRSRRGEARRPPCIAEPTVAVCRRQKRCHFRLRVHVGVAHQNLSSIGQATHLKLRAKATAVLRWTVFALVSRRPLRLHGLTHLHCSPQQAIDAVHRNEMLDKLVQAATAKKAFVGLQSVEGLKDNLLDLNKDGHGK